MNRVFLTLTDSVIQKFNWFSAFIEKVADTLLPNTIVSAYCIRTKLCYITTGPKCNCGCDYNTCRERVGTNKVYWYASDTVNCTSTCIGLVKCENCYYTGYRCSVC
jgi:hypothetical protein